MTCQPLETRMSEHSQSPVAPPNTINLADARLGAVALSASDEFFAPKERLLNPAEPQWREGVYDDHGKWMDGWESRRRRDGGFDHVILRLAAAGTVSLLEIDTRFFTGNYPPHAQVLACRCDGDPADATAWHELLPHTALRGNQRHQFPVAAGGIWTHLKLNIFPDGGVARLRAYGQVHRDWSAVADGPVDLAAALNGGRALACSDEHYGSMHNLLLPGRGATMADGWETRRRREPGFDWVILQLGHVGRVDAVEIDTAHFKGNFPHQVSVHAARLGAAEGDTDLASRCLYWPVLLEGQLLRADAVQRFSAELRPLGPVTHVRVNMHPDGGISRVRIVGRPERS
jgi:allantoicase